MATEQDDDSFAGVKRANRAVAVIRKALAELGEDSCWLIPLIAEDMVDLSIAPEILNFATGPTAGCASGRPSARLYLALQGRSFNIRGTRTAFDAVRQHWWLRAMFDSMTGCWGGTADGVRAIERRHPELRISTSSTEVQQ